MRKIIAYMTTISMLLYHVSVFAEIPFSCTEQDYGEIDIVGNVGKCGHEVEVAVRLQNTPNDLSAFAFKIEYHPEVVEFISYSKGNLAQNMNMFDVTDRHGYLKVGGTMFGDFIPEGSSGNLVFLKFIVSPKVTKCDKFEMTISEVLDDMVSWSTSGGCVGGCNGDVNDDNTITPGDALMAFDKTMEVCPTSSNSLCPEVCCDVNSDNECTPNDALCIFSHYMERPSCLDYYDYWKQNTVQ